jgi:hypothetical protein
MVIGGDLQMIVGLITLNYTFTMILSYEAFALSIDISPHQMMSLNSYMIQSYCTSHSFLSWSEVIGL